jgi:hypothetical protein
VQVIVTTVGFRQTAARELHPDEGTKPRVFHVLARGYDLQLVRRERLARDVLHDREGTLADERNRHRVGAHALARDAAGGVGGVEGPTKFRMLVVTPVDDERRERRPRPLSRSLAIRTQARHYLGRYERLMITQ